MKAIADGVTAIDDPDIRSIRREMIKERTETWVCWEDQLERHNLRNQGQETRDRILCDIKFAYLNSITLTRMLAFFCPCSHTHA